MRFTTFCVHIYVHLFDFFISVPLGVVKLHPPGNVTVGYIGTYNIYIYWYEPENYHLSIPVAMNISDNIHETTAGEHLTIVNKTATGVKSIWPNMTYHVVTSKPEQETSTTRETNVTSTADWIGHKWVPFHKAHLLSYTVTWKENGTGKIIIIIVTLDFMEIFNLHL